MAPPPEAFSRILRHRLLPAVVLPRADQAVPLARAYLAGGLDVMEVTFRNAEAPDAVRRIRAEVPAMAIGAGTLLTPAQVAEAVAVGAQFGVTPGFNPTVIRAAHDHMLPIIPGVMTPGEIEQALELGCTLLKFFPAGAAGGIPYLQALAGPYAHTGLRLICLGGVGPENLAAFVKAPLVGAVGGSWLSDKALLEAGSWAEITHRVRQALALTQSPTAS